ncbi:hypothetical protein B7494_g1218 [Chlorociboria aeruginascens]|nr:hypothetical protein B7494_g1218 [Chlorociboria aeruginascens]
MTSTNSPAAHIKALDHFVLTVKSIPKTTEWYSQNLGMRPETYVPMAAPDVTRHSLIFGSSKINLHELGKVGCIRPRDIYILFDVVIGVFAIEFDPKALRVKDGSADLCFLTDDDVKEVRQRLITAGVEMVDLGNEKSDKGIVNRTGARGQLRSVYCRDPDGNLIEYITSF